MSYCIHLTPNKMVDSDHVCWLDLHFTGERDDGFIKFGRAYFSVMAEMFYGFPVGQIIVRSNIMWVKQCHEPAIWGKHTRYIYGDWGMIMIIYCDIMGIEKMWHNGNIMGYSGSPEIYIRGCYWTLPISGGFTYQNGSFSIATSVYKMVLYTRWFPSSFAKLGLHTEMVV